MGTRIRLLGLALPGLLILAACTQAPDAVPSPTEPLATGPTATATGSTGSSKPAPVRVDVPSLGGMTIAEARAALREVGLRVSVVKHESPKPKGSVIDQALRAGESVRPGRLVHLVVAKPEPPPPCDNPWCYTFAGGSYISNPPSDFCSYFRCIDSFWDGRGYVIQCADGDFSKSGGISGSCSYHGGNRRYLYAP